MGAVGCTAEEIDIRPSCLQMLKDIGHPFAKGEQVYDIAFENVQAGERTSHLFRLANQHGGFVVGTGDLSELALGWCTYGVGDHMSHYNVNASVPKTLIQYLVRWVADRSGSAPTCSARCSTCSTPRSAPSWFPARRQPTRAARASVGPYELQDFHLYHVLRFGYAPTKVAFLAWTRGTTQVRRWPTIPSRAQRYGSPRSRTAHLPGASSRPASSSAARVPNAPKVGSGGSLSPRGDWRAPSDGNATTWLQNLAEVPDRD